MAKSRMTISLSSIVWFAIMGYIFFGGDDNDSKEVKIHDQDKPVISETIKEDAKRIGKELTVLVKDAASEIQSQLEEKRSEDPKPEPPPKREPEMVAEPEKPIEKLKPLTDDKPSTGEMKKLWN